MRSRRNLGLGVTVTTQNVTLMHAETERSEHRGPALARDNAHRAAAVKTEVGFPVEKKQDYVIGA